MNRVAKSKSIFSVLVCSLVLAAFSAVAHSAHRVLDPERSSLHFMSTKNTHITEQHSFDKFSGKIAADGTLNIDIDLSSVNTIIPIRNERMREMLFDIANYPSAQFTAKVDPATMKLSAGERKQVSVSGTLTLKEKTQAISLDLVLVGLSDGAIQASTLKPVVLNTQLLGVQDGIDALQKVAMLSSISKTVPVNFSVVFLAHKN